MNDQTFLHQHTVLLTKLIQLNQELRNVMLMHKENQNNEAEIIKETNQNLKKEAKKKTKLVDVI